MNRLKDLASFDLEGERDHAMPELMSVVADYMPAGRVSLMLLDTEGDKDRRLTLVAAHGALPKVAWQEKPRLGQGVAGRVMAQGQSLIVPGANADSVKDVRRRPGRPDSFIVCPVPIAGLPAGVLNISDGPKGTPFTDGDLVRAELAAILVGRAIHLVRLKGMLDSSFAQMAMVRGGVTDASAFMRLSAQEPQKVARMLALSFYKEMHRCGFTFNQILHAAGDIITELTANLDRHKKRQARTEGQEQDK